MALNDEQLTLLMTNGEFQRRIQIAAIKVAGTIRDEVVGEIPKDIEGNPLDGDVPLTLSRHKVRFNFTNQFTGNSEQYGRKYAPEVAAALDDYLTWPSGVDDPQQAVKQLVADSITSDFITAVLLPNIDFIAGWDAASVKWETDNP